MTPEAFASIGTSIDAIDDIEPSIFVVAEFIDYIRWLADQEAGRQIAIGDIWTLYYEAIRVGRHWTDICDGLKLPIREDWS